jgi:deoxyribodipyrimidine photolyase-related protein
VLVLGDQLTRTVGPLAAADPARTVVLLIESVDLIRRTRAHRQKIVAFLGAMRRFGADLARDGFTVHHEQLAPSFAAGIAAHAARYPGVRLRLMEPADRGVADELARAATAVGAAIEVVANPLWLVDDATFDAYAAGRSRWKMEDFYRRVRAQRGWLMEPASPGTPLGGRWNHDADNRRTPPPGTRYPPPAAFGDDPLLGGVQADVDAHFADHPGRSRPFAWPLSRAEALAALDDFVTRRLVDFGPYEDALVSGERTLFHSRLSLPLNLGLLHPQEVVERALAAFHAPGSIVPIASIEGFVRQVLGWREYLHHVDRRRGAELEQANALAHHAALPAAYWTGETRMACFADAWRGLHDSGYGHHIERLMIFGNLALSLGVAPREVLFWFTAMYVDALDWVMVPNVMGMSQYADGGTFTTKPYLSGGNYLHRMGDHCRRCPFDPGERAGARACPFTVGYWDFIDRHQERFARHPRMAVIVAAWRARPEPEQAALRATAAALRTALP